jgi:hypothetical protein
VVEWQPFKLRVESSILSARTIIPSLEQRTYGGHEHARFYRLRRVKLIASGHDVVAIGSRPMCGQSDGRTVCLFAR